MQHMQHNSTENACNMCRTSACERSPLPPPWHVRGVREARALHERGLVHCMREASSTMSCTA